MMASLIASVTQAAITAAPGTPAPDGTTEAVEIRDIAPPLDVFPYPPWMVAVAALLALALLGMVVWLIVRWIRSRPGPPPLGARAIALGELGKLRARVTELEPYVFSIAVSDVLRTFVSNAKFRLSATRQTSPEFLAAISGSPLFSEHDRALLTRFLEKCDMIKFARVQATSDDNAELVATALDFVQGDKA
jgi:hypothetical protein